jgi:pimeloyl-ACP methyl ester carboxylesterase
MASGIIQNLVLAVEPQAVAADAGIVKTHHRAMKIQGINIAYREAGDPAKPTIVLLHGFPTSSHMFRNLIPKLSAKYHVLAPDYPGFGASDMPKVNKFDYSFKNFANVVDTFLTRKNVKNYALYVMDYGAPVGYRLFAKHPERVTGFVIQNGNAYSQGLKEFWKPIKALWANRTKANEDALRAFFTLKITKWQYTHGVKDVSLVSPDNWLHDQYLLDRPGNQDIQIELFHSYGTNVGEYPKWQKLFRQYQPPALLVWGKNDYIFPEAGAHPYKRDLKNLEFHILDAGHFALETHGRFIADKMIDFLGRTQGRRS